MRDWRLLRFDDFRIDLTDERLWRDDKHVRLTPKTFAMLRCLAERPGQLVTKEELLDAVWPETVVSESVLTNCMRELRRALGDQARAPQFIETVHRRGYRFMAEIVADGSSRTASVPSVERDPMVRRLAAMMSADVQGDSRLLVGREAELDQLRQQWFTAQDSQRQVVFVTGEAGIGKTTLVEAFVHEVMQHQEVVVSRGQCIDHYGVGEAYLPLLEALGLLLRGPQGPDFMPVLKREAPSWLLQLPAFVSEAEFDMLQRRASGATRERMLRELAEAIETLTQEHPLLLILEDLHWSDLSTLAWLSYVAWRRAPARLMILSTYRSVDAMMQQHPVQDMMQELQRHGLCAELALSYLSQAGICVPD
ncbi:MAG: hypothetical protein ETSY2_48760, partial [Candidatus Entotheonella gemina]